MAQLIRIKRGLKATLPASSTDKAGELKFATDTKELFIDTGAENVCFPSGMDTHIADKTNPHAVTAAQVGLSTWANVTYTAASGITVVNFSAKYNAALNIMHLHFNYETITTFTIGMLVLTLALPVTLSSARRGIIILDAPSATRRVACDVDVNPGGNITLYPCMEQFTGTVPALDGSKLHGDIWVYMG